MELESRNGWASFSGKGQGLVERGVLDQYGELIAADSRQGVARPHQALEQGRDLAQQLEANHGVRVIVEDDGQETMTLLPERVMVRSGALGVWSATRRLQNPPSSV